MKIGFIGIGQMGKRMSKHLLDAGYDLAIHDLTKESARYLLEKGARWMDTPKDVAGSCEIILSSLPGPHEVEEVVYGANGLMAGWKKGDIYIDMSTNSPTTIRQVSKDAEAKGVTVLDAPVSGGIQGAETGTLTIMVGGELSSLEKVRKILETVSEKIFHMGDIGCGSVAKLVNNLILSACGAINAEGMVLGVKAGIDAEKLYEVLRSSSANNVWLERNCPQVLKGNFEPGFRTNLVLKDMELVLALSKEYGVPLPVGAITEQRFLEAKAAGFGEKGTQSIFLRLEELAGVQVRSPEYR